MVWIAFFFSIVTGCLSAWQWYRLSWKEGIIRDMNVEYAKPSAEAGEGLKEFRQVSFKGKWIQTPLFLQYKIRKGEIGCEVVCPFQHENGSVFLVKRGWQKSCTVMNIEESMEVSGIVRAFLKYPQGTPENTPPKEWYYMNANEMQEVMQVSFNHQFYIDVAKELPQLPNNHFMYAVTWAILSVVFLIKLCGVIRQIK